MTSSKRFHTPHCCLITSSGVPQAGDKAAFSNVSLQSEVTVNTSTWYEKVEKFTCLTVCFGLSPEVMLSVHGVPVWRE